MSTADPARFDLSLVVPAYDEESRLPATLDRLAVFAADSGLAVEVIVADDGSTDGTADVARRFTACGGNDRRPASIVVRLVTIAHRGKGAAVRAGLRRAAAPIVGYCDADLSAGPDAIARLYTEVKGGSDLAIASRGLPESVLDVRQPWYRERAGRIFNSLLRSLVGIPFHDTQCGLKLFRQEVVTELLRHQRIDGFAFDAEIVVLAVRLGFDVREVPVRWSHDPHTRVSMLRDSLAMSRDIVRIVRRLRAGKLHALGIPAAAALEAMTRSENDHWWYVAKRLLISRYWRTDAVAGRCLDVGCGGGATLAEATTAMPAFGVDLSPDAVGHGRRAGLSTLARAEATALPFADGSFSVAFALDVLEHHPVPEQLAREVNRVLTGTGLLVVTVPAYKWMWSYSDHVLGHYRRYTRSELVDELTSAGFSVERATYFHSWLLPVAWAFRRLRSLTGRTESADDFPVPHLVNRVLLGVSRLEQRYLTRHDLPFGLSILAVARPDGAARRALPSPVPEERSMTSVDPDLVSEHNRSQRQYFERASHRTLRPTGSLYLRRHVDLMSEFAGIAPGDRVLEVGCGMGRYTLLLAERGVAVEGLDLSPHLLEQLQACNAGRPEIPVHGFDIVDCPPEMYGTFDAVVGFMVLHHVHDLEKCLAVAAKLVRPGGRVAFLEPNPANPLYYVQITLTPEMAWKGERGMLRMTTRHMYPAMSRAGLEDLSFRRFGLFPPFVTNRRLGAMAESALEGAPLGSPARPFHLFGGRRPTEAGAAG